MAMKPHPTYLFANMLGSACKQSFVPMKQQKCNLVMMQIVFSCNPLSLLVASYRSRESLESPAGLQHPSGLPASTDISLPLTPKLHDQKHSEQQHWWFCCRIAAQGLG